MQVVSGCTNSVVADMGSCPLRSSYARGETHTSRALTTPLSASCCARAAWPASTPVTPTAARRVSSPSDSARQALRSSNTSQPMSRVFQLGVARASVSASRPSPGLSQSTGPSGRASNTPTRVPRTSAHSSAQSGCRCGKGSRHLVAVPCWTCVQPSIDCSQLTCAR